MMKADGSNTEKKEIFVVLGVGRSGTSTIARGLVELGIDFGAKLKPSDSVWNPKGFFEDLDITHTINRGVVAALDYSWKSMDEIEQLCRENASLLRFKQAAVDLLEERMSSVWHWGFKDPSTAKVLPFWQDVFATANLNDNYIIALRNPLASAQSYQRVTGADIEQSLLYWIMHLIAAIDGTHGKQRLIMSYELMLQNPRLQLDRIKRNFNVPPQPATDKGSAYADQFIDKKLQHFAYSDADLQTNSAVLVAPLCAKMYALLLRLAKDEINFASVEFKNGWAEIKAEFAKIHPVYCYIETLLAKHKQLEREIRTIRKSFPWKLIYPVRFIDDSLRALRRKTRLNRKLLKAHE